MRWFPDVRVNFVTAVYVPEAACLMAQKICGLSKEEVGASLGEGWKRFTFIGHSSNRR